MNFRRCILAMAMLALFVSLASAQVLLGPSTGAPAGPLNCGIGQGTVPAPLRAEGMTELVGDIVIQCTGGSPLAPGTVIPTVNITVSLQANITSRLTSSSATSTLADRTSEAVLLIDEPNSATATGGGTTAGFTVCQNTVAGASLGGCLQGVGADGQSAVCTSNTAVGTCTTTVQTTTPAPNVYQGVLTGPNQVTFVGIPVNPPTTGNVARFYRITNIRANISSIAAGTFAGTTPVFAFISISGLLLQNAQPIVGNISGGLVTSIRGTDLATAGAVSLAQCAGSTSPSFLRLLRYSEGFPTAFKTRVLGSDIGTAAGQNQSTSAPLHFRPGGNVSGSESGLILSSSGTPAATPVGGLTPGLADYGTRLKATFNNVPAGVRIFVSTTNLRVPPAGTAVVAATAADVSFAQLVPSETGTTGQVVAKTGTGSGSTAFDYTEIIPVGNTATAVWEVLKSNPGSTETDQFNFAVWQQFSPAPGATPPSPATGTSTVTMSFAPTPNTSGVPFTAAQGSVASSSLTIPRFSDSNSTAANLFTINLCKTALLFPYVVNAAGFDTGIAIANTTSDPFGTRTQSGTCDLNFYGGTTNPAKFTTANIPSGQSYVDLISARAAGFQGYVIAVCNFQLAHGIAFISDIGAREFAFGYIALALQGNDSTTRNSVPKAADMETLGH